MKSVCVFCGSAMGAKPEYANAAKAMGLLLAGKGINVVFGGGRIGLMGVVADAALSGGGKVTGVIPYFLSTKEIAHHGLTELLIVNSMHERKNKMAELSDGFIALPGGIGTLEELFEIFSWDYLHLHHKPIGILNVGGFYDRMLDHLRYSVSEGFLKQSQFERLLIANDPETLLRLMQERVIKGEQPLDKRRT